jgi:hypothetical protein
MRAILSAVVTACSLVLVSTGYAVAGTPPVSVPEPTSMALIAAGAAAVAWVKFRGRR